MDWRECAASKIQDLGINRFSWPGPNNGGFDCTENFTVTDVLGGFHWVISWPGDWVLSHELFRTFFEIPYPGPIGATGSLVLGYTFIALVLVGMIDGFS